MAKDTTAAGSVTDEVLDRIIEASVKALNLPLEEAWRPAVRTNLRVTLQLAALVEDFPLPDEAEPAPVFRA